MILPQLSLLLWYQSLVSPNQLPMLTHLSGTKGFRDFKVSFLEKLAKSIKDHFDMPNFDLSSLYIHQYIHLDEITIVDYLVSNWGLFVLIYLGTLFLWCFFKMVMMRHKEDRYSKICSFLSEFLNFNFPVWYFLSEFLNLNAISLLNISQIKKSSPITNAYGYSSIPVVLLSLLIMITLMLFSILTSRPSKTRRMSYLFAGLSLWKWRTQITFLIWFFLFRLLFAVNIALSWTL